MVWGLAVTGGLGLVAAYALLRTGGSVVARPGVAAFRMANGAFALGWFSLALMVTTDGARVLSALAGAPDPALYLVLIELKIIATAGAITGFGAYVLFLWTGRQWVWMPIAAFGVVHASFFLTLTLMRLPLTVAVGDWATRVQLTPGSRLPGGDAVGIALYFLPLVGLAALYLGLWRRVETRTQHWRLVLVAGCLFLFFGAAAVQSNPAVSPDGPGVPLALLVMLAAAWVARWTFEPPAWFSRRFDIHGLRTESHPGVD